MKTQRNIFYIIALIIGVTTFTSCDDYLDKLPDSRIQLNSPQKIKDLLVTSYPKQNYSVIGELSSDNFIDNRAPNAAGLYYNVNAFDRMDNDLFAWEDVEAADREDIDAPFSLWEDYYQTISAANHVLEAIDELEAKGTYTDNMNPQRGEALMLRAYAHFILVNIFGHTYKDAETSKNDLGIAFIDKPATNLTTRYERKSVAEVYDLIQLDIEKGLPLIDDDAYEVPTYHFTRAAANAFAARFFLFKRDYPKVIEHANAVLGTGDPTSLLRDWSQNYNNAEHQSNAYISEKSRANLLILPTNSAFERRFRNYRYGSNGNAQNGSFNDGGPTWSGRPNHLLGWVWTYGQNYGVFLGKILEYFEYTDRVALTGYVHIVRTEFTTDATLLDRAEAKIFLNDIDGAVQDLQAWNRSHQMTTPLTRQLITNYYTPGKAYFVFDFHNQELSPEFIVTEEQKPFVDCVLHFRRVERIFEGDRWFDIKRYGIEIEHIIGPTAVRKRLAWNDEHRALQIPSDVINAGVQPNPRPVLDAPNQTLVPQLVD